MTRLAIACALAAVTACTPTHKHISECDELVVTIDKLSTCPKLDPAGRSAIAASSKQIKDALATLDQGGGVGKAPAELVQALRDTCKAQQQAIVVPGCPP